MNNSQGHRASWVLGQEIVLDELIEDHIPSWPFLKEPSKQIIDHIYKVDTSGVSWITLYEHRSKSNSYEKHETSYHGLRQREFRYLMCVFVTKTDREKLTNFLSVDKNLDVMEWDPIELTDGPFLGEAPWRNTWPQDKIWSDLWRIPKGISISFPACDYHWESHLDAALPEGARAFIPSPWLAKEMSIVPDKMDASLYRSINSSIVFVGSRLGEDGSTALIEKQSLANFLLEKDLQCLWLFVGDRSVWPGGDNHDAAWRRSEGLCWIDNGKPVLKTWSKDGANGRSKIALSKNVKGKSKTKHQQKRHR